MGFIACAERDTALVLACVFTSKVERNDINK
jgi:hypothetical protein